MEYTTHQKYQIMRQLLLYQLDNGIASYNYYIEICDKLGIALQEEYGDRRDKKKKPALKNPKTGRREKRKDPFNERDPLNWYEGHEPSKEKLRLYVKFIKTVYKNFKFVDSTHAEYIQIGFNFSRFSLGELSASSKKFLSRAKNLDGAIFVSDPYIDKTFKRGFLEFIAIRRVAASPFLFAYRFQLFPSDKIPAGIPFIENYLAKRKEDNSRVDYASLASIAAEINKNFYSLFDGGKYAIGSSEKGLLSPCSDGEYMGILKSTVSESSQITFITVGNPKKPKDCALSLIGTRDPGGRTFFPCGNLKNFKEMIIEMGEPLS